MMRGVTIGQAAAFAGVTTKTVRHYHRLGLVPEPERDSSGYRRYGSEDLLRLVRVRTLAGAGVPLAEVAELLDAGPEEFARAVADVEQQLSERIEELVARRAMLRRLAGGDRLLLPERATALLERLVSLGFSDDYVDTQRDSVVLVRALVPEAFDDFLAQQESQLDDPELVELTKRSWEARSWDPFDPRLEALADALADRLVARHLPTSMPPEYRARPNSVARYEIINHHKEEQLPAIARLNELIEARLRAAGLEVPRSG